MTSGMPTVVCDAGPLIHLSELNCLDLLLDFERVLIPEVVAREAQAHRPEVLASFKEHFEQIPASQIVIPTILEPIQKSYALHPGELAALALVLQQSGAIFLTDDAAARIAAQTLGMTVHGSIGVLLRSLRRQQRTKPEVLSLLRQLPALSTLHIAPKLLASIIGEVEQL
jgi:predicted nucleic acid-binding protein